MSMTVGEAQAICRRHGLDIFGMDDNLFRIAETLQGLERRLPPEPICDRRPSRAEVEAAMVEGVSTWLVSDNGYCFTVRFQAGDVLQSDYVGYSTGMQGECMTPFAGANAPGERWLPIDPRTLEPMRINPETP